MSNAINQPCPNCKQFGHVYGFKLPEKKHSRVFGWKNAYVVVCKNCLSSSVPDSTQEEAVWNWVNFKIHCRNLHIVRESKRIAQHMHKLSWNNLKEIERSVITSEPATTRFNFIEQSLKKQEFDTELVRICDEKEK